MLKTGLRNIDAAKQAAILNALPAHILLLDTMGLIVSVNSAWHQVTCPSALIDPKYEVGVSYLEVCDHAEGDGAVDAHRAALGIRAVLARDMPRFLLEYSCHSPAGRLWFLLTVSPLNDYLPNGALGHARQDNRTKAW
jgi:hypothetical protein